jgi:ectoine hydroxylase-related dioxygenase (phytanoyl-CoA dioxygenase family)
MLSQTDKQAFDEAGYVVVPGLLDGGEVDAVLDALGSERVSRSTHERVDAEGRSSRLSIWTDLGDDIFSRVARHRGLVEGARLLLGADVYHWHSKVMFKEAGGGGSWEWHQDYGYWYGDRCLAPDMLSVMVALDPASKANGCLRVLGGSHRLGRLDHGTVGDQAGADPTRLAAALERFPVHHLEAEPGAAIFFHCNTLHSSQANLSDRPRRAMICAFNAMANAPYDGSGPPVVPIETVETVAPPVPSSQGTT